MNVSVRSISAPARVAPAFALVVALSLAACASPVGNVAPAQVANGVLTTPSGMTLYTFDRDAAGSGKSACNGPCVANWPAFVASSDNAAMGNWTVVMRDDGGRQWAYKGKPLYTFTNDSKPGEKTGDGVNDVWHLARP